MIDYLRLKTKVGIGNGNIVLISSKKFKVGTTGSETFT